MLKHSLALGLAALTLAACGTLHPGAAAVVGNKSISMKSLDDTARVYCLLAVRAGGQQGVDSVSNAEVRLQAITDMVTAIVARDVADDQGVTPDARTYEITESQRQQIDKAFPADSAAVSTAIQNSQETSAIAIALGEKETGSVRAADNESDLASRGQGLILKAFKSHDVEFAPQFGLSGTMKQLSPTGSLSVPEVSFDQPSEDQLPAAQRCS